MREYSDVEKESDGEVEEGGGGGGGRTGEGEKRKVIKGEKNRGWKERE